MQHETHTDSQMTSIFFEYPRLRKAQPANEEKNQRNKYQVNFGDTLKITSEFLEILLQKWKYFNKEIGEITSKLKLLKEKEQETGNKTYAYFKVDRDQVKMVNLSPNVFAFYLKCEDVYERIVDNFMIPCKPLHVKMTFYGISLVGFKMGVHLPFDLEKSKIRARPDTNVGDDNPLQIQVNSMQKGPYEKKSRKGVPRGNSIETIRHSSLMRSSPKNSSSKIVTCTVCLDKKNTWRGVLDCTHDYCFDCIHKWMEDNKNCPICKRNSLLVREFRKKRFIKSHRVSEMFLINEIDSNLVECSQCNMMDPIHLMISCARCNNVSMHIDCAQFSTRGPVNYRWLCNHCLMPSDQEAEIQEAEIQTNLNLSMPQDTQHTVPNSENSVDSAPIDFPRYSRIHSANDVPKRDVKFTRWESQKARKSNTLSGEYSFSGTLRIKRRFFREYADKKDDGFHSKPNVNSKFYHGDNYTFIEQYSAERFSVSDIKRVEEDGNPFLEDNGEEKGRKKDQDDSVVMLGKRSNEVSINFEGEDLTKPRETDKKESSSRSQGDLRVINEFSAKTKSISSIDNFVDRGDPIVKKLKRVNIRMKSPTANFKYEELPIQRVKDEIFERIFNKIQSVSREKSVSNKPLKERKKDL